MSPRSKLWIALGGVAFVALLIAGVAAGHQAGMRFAAAHSGDATFPGALFSNVSYANASDMRVVDHRFGYMAHSANGNTATITLPANATVVTHDAVPDWSPAGATITYADNATARLVLSKNATLVASGNVLTITLPTGGGFEASLERAHGWGHGFGWGMHGGWGHGPMHHGFGRDRGLASDRGFAGVRGFAAAQRGADARARASSAEHE